MQTTGTENKPKTKYKMVYQILKSRIRSLPAGSKLPSVRDMMAEFDVSQLTITKALDKLAKENLIYSEPYKGIYARDNSLEPIRKLHKFIIAAPDYYSFNYDADITAIAHEANERGEVVKVIRYDWRERIFTKRYLIREDVDGLVIIPTSANLSPSDIAKLNSFNIPIVVWDRNFNGLNIDSIYYDDEYGGELAAKHLIELGHTRLAVLASEPKVATVMNRIKGFIKFAGHYGIEAKIIDCEVNHGEDAADKTYHMVKEYISENGLDITGLFVCSSATAISALCALHECGIEIPEQMSVVCYGDSPITRFSWPPLTEIKRNPTMAAKSAIEILEGKINKIDSAIVNHAILPELVIRSSTNKYRG